MLEYGNLSAIEFEYLCQDIMQKKLNISLRRFASGRDEGIDLTDDLVNKTIIIQVKHYYKSNFSALKKALQKELDNVKKLNPKQYYICCSQILTPKNVLEIYSIFSDYMNSEKNVISLFEIDQFLENNDNIVILRRHFKLWLSATNILSEISNQDIFIDSEVLLYDINQDLPYYVQTDIYLKSKAILENCRLLMLIGNPGVGKTTISKMIVLYFASIGYRVRYTTNGDISNIKMALSLDKETKEIVLLDDCLGQCYFKLKDTQENELSSLVKYIHNNPNKILLLNSRISIFNEAKERSIEFNKLFDNEKLRIKTIDVNEIPLSEKALILYSHLRKYNVPNEYYASVRNEHNYQKIVTHYNYNPRIIEYVTRKFKDSNPNNYFNYILDRIENPSDVWKDEFERRLNAVDRYFMYTIYSITNTTVESKYIKMAFDCIIKEIDIDLSLNYFDSLINRLSKSLIRIVANERRTIITPAGMHFSTHECTKEIGVLNPSINDYLKTVFSDSEYIRTFFIKNALFFEQIGRLCNSENELNSEIIERINSDKLIYLKTTKKCDESIILYYVAKFNLLKEKYQSFILKGLEIFPVNFYVNRFFHISHKKAEIIERLLSEPFFDFYHISDIINSISGISVLYLNLGFKDIICISNLLNNQVDFSKIDRESFIKITKEYFNKAAQDYADNKSSYYDPEEDPEFKYFTDTIFDDLYEMLDESEISEIDFEDIDVDIIEWSSDYELSTSDLSDEYTYQKDEVDLILDRNID